MRNLSPISPPGSRGVLVPSSSSSNTAFTTNNKAGQSIPVSKNFPRRSDHADAMRFSELFTSCSSASTTTAQTSDIPSIPNSKTTTNSNSSPPSPLVDEQQQTHLLVLVNGLFGSRHNWAAISELLRTHVDKTSTLVHISTANEFRATYAGIDVCGRRLAEEIRTLAATHSNLERISFLGHSMGGLISRFAVGELYDLENKKIAGLTPSHYMSLATPHIGCRGEAGVAQVPIVSWLTLPPAFCEIPFGLGRLPAVASAPIAAAAFRRTGRQFFLLDRDTRGMNTTSTTSTTTASTTTITTTSSSANENEVKKEEQDHLLPPLMYRLSQDWPREGKYYFSGLAAFETRTCYANRSGDHLVGWSNASVRQLHELPDGIGVEKGKGVVREDPLESAWAAEERQQVESTEEGRVLDVAHSHVAAAEDIFSAESAEDLVQREIRSNSNNTTTTTTIARKIDEQDDDDDYGINSCGKSKNNIEIQAPLLDANASTAEYLDASLASLQRLAWRRIDVCFAGAKLSLLAHQHLQVQRKWANWEGMATGKHLAMQFAAMEELRREKQEAAAAAAN